MPALRSLCVSVPFLLAPLMTTRLFAALSLGFLLGGLLPSAVFAQTIQGTPAPDPAVRGITLADGDPLAAAYNWTDLGVDAAGGLHAVFYLRNYGDGPEHFNYYGYCSPQADCTLRAAWVLVRLTDGFPHQQIRVTPDGRARVLFFQDAPLSYGSDRTLYRYATCERACAEGANWSVGDLWTVQDFTGGYALDHASHQFALDALGRPRFVYRHGTEWLEAEGRYETTEYYALCNTGCATAANWQRYRLPENTFSRSYSDGFERTALALTSDGRPAFFSVLPIPGTGTSETGDNYLVYVECVRDCEAAGWWSTPAPILPISDLGEATSWTLAFSEGRPRLAVKPGRHEPLWYAWCDGECSNNQNWYGYPVQFGDAEARHPALALDAQGLPRMAFNQGVDLGYAWCERDCETASPLWRYTTAERASALNQDVPVPVPPGDCKRGWWTAGYRPSLSLDAAGNPRIAHDGEFLMECYDDPQRPNDAATHINARWWASRVLFFAHPGGGATPAEPPAVLPYAALEPAYPNPTRGAVAIPFTLAQAGRARIALYDALGREVDVLLDGHQPAGGQVLSWDASPFPAGVYTLRLETGGPVSVRPLIVAQ